MDSCELGYQKPENKRNTNLLEIKNKSAFGLLHVPSMI